MKPYIFSGKDKLYEYNINTFLGVDFTNNPLQVSPDRSPQAKNFIIGDDGYPVCRYGYCVNTRFETGERINGIHQLRLGDELHTFYHVGKSLYYGPANEIVIDGEMEDRRSTSFQHEGKLYLLDGWEFMVITVTEGRASALTVMQTAYVPTTCISSPPSGGGEPFEERNLLSHARKNRFLGTKDDLTYQLDNTEIYRVNSVEKLTEEGTWEIVSRNDYTVDLEKGQVTFKSGKQPGESPKEGRDNVIITYSRQEDATINQCAFMVRYDVYGGTDRFFYSGNPYMPNYDWYSVAGDPTYVPEGNYTKIGGEDRAIMGYSRLADGSLAIHKEEGGREDAIFYRTGKMEDGKPVFPIKGGAAMHGAVSPHCFAMLGNEPLFLSSEGVFATVPVSNHAVNERCLEKRSYYIDRKLRGLNLSNAVAIVYKGRYYLACNGKVFIGDNRKGRTRAETFDGEMQYEWAYWDNIPVRVWFTDGTHLYFGTEDGRVCRFCSSIDFDEYAYLDIDKNVEFEWYTPLLDFGTKTRYKNLKNFFITCAPHSQSRVSLSYVIRSIETFIKKQDLNIFDFSNLDFEHFSFETDENPRIVVSGRKAKKFMMIQFAIKAAEGLPFGFYSLGCQYRIKGNYKG